MGFKSRSQECLSVSAHTYGAGVDKSILEISIAAQQLPL